MGPNLHKNAILVRNTITITECTLQPHSNFSIKISHSKYMLRRDYQSHSNSAILRNRLIRLSSRQQIQNAINRKMKSYFHALECGKGWAWERESERKRRKKNGILMSLIWKLFCCVAFGWNLLLFTIAQSEYKCNAWMHLSKNAV